jgi:membrane protease YdiL (CAAX protease family)
LVKILSAPVKFAELKALGLGVSLLLAVYIPAFVVTALIRPRIELAIALIVAVTLLVATLLIFVLARARAGFGEFGFAIPHSPYVGIALASGLALGLVAALLNHLVPSKPPFDVSGFAPWKIGLYFVVGASIQEEVIFRGLIQSIVERHCPALFSLRGVSISIAAAFAAVLFAAVHLEVGVVVAVGALILGVVAGELRRRSGSLLPAIIVHALFNCVDAVWH